jgi:hypothetical protein
MKLRPYPLFAVSAACIFILSISSCVKNPGYYEVPVNHPVFANKNEAQVSGVVGLSGLTMKGGYSVTDHVGAIAMWTVPIGSQEYRTREGEFGGGYFIPMSGGNFVNAFYGGFGFGHNAQRDSGESVDNYNGNFYKIFISAGGGSTQGHIGRRVRVSGGYALKFTYIDYKGFKYNNGLPYTFTASNFYFAPYIWGNIGGKRVRFEYGTSMPIKLDFRWANNTDHNLRILPFHFNIGLVVIINRHYTAVE